MGFGVVGLFGNWFGGCLVDCSLLGVILLFVLLMVLGMFVLVLIFGNVWLFVVILVIWGVV